MGASLAAPHRCLLDGEHDSGLPLLGMASSTLFRWIREGLVPVDEPVPGAPWLVRINAASRSRVCKSVPAGFAAVAQARELLLVSRHTLWERIRRGESEARSIVRGPLRGLYV